MKSGLLWFDDSKKKPLSQKISEAQARYKEKFGVFPNTIFINPHDGAKDDVQFEICRLFIEKDGGTLSTKPTVMANHIWLGIDESKVPVTDQPEALA